jgi:hypothetical protein
MYNRLWTLAVVAELIVTGCGGHHHSTATDSSPTDFANFVNQQVKMQPAFGAIAASTASLTGDLGLEGTNPFASVSFGQGDALPAGTYQAVVACSEAGNSACNPTISADLNSTLN